MAASQWSRVFGQKRGRVRSTERRWGREVEQQHVTDADKRRRLGKTYKIT